jgi:hypothetical protein
MTLEEAFGLERSRGAVVLRTVGGQKQSERLGKGERRRQVAMERPVGEELPRLLASLP